MIRADGPAGKDSIYSGALKRTLQVHDARADIARASRRSCDAEDAFRAFLQNKRESIRSDPRLTPSEKERALAKIAELR